MKGIYKITHKESGKCYIGESVNIANRISAHKCCKEDKPLYRTLRKYGIENFTFDVLHDMGEDATKDDLLDFEYLYKIYYNSFHNGYNLVEGREDPRKSPSIETRNKMSKSRTGEKHYLFGKKHSPETIKKMSEAKKGKKHSDEAKRKMSDAHSGEKNGFFGKKHNQKTLEKMSKPVIGTCKSTGKVTKYYSATEAGRAIGKRHGHISSCCTGKRKSAYGYFWRWYNADSR